MQEPHPEPEPRQHPTEPGHRERSAPPRRTDFRRFTAVTPRWNDNDVFGHVNNAEYYAYFDTAVMQFLVGEGVIAITGGALGAVVAETGCRFLREILFTDAVTVGIRVEHIGRSSVRYRIGIFRNDDDVAAAVGHFVHVFIDRTGKRPVAIADEARRVLSDLMLEDGG
ncbi:MAG: thioesterase family protein [Microvirga sp.]